MLGRDNGLKGCAARTGKPAAALDPVARLQQLADMPCRKACVRRQSDISIGEKL
jgi:hypothetical protein